jgi:hypothetical protein
MSESFVNRGVASFAVEPFASLVHNSKPPQLHVTNNLSAASDLRSDKLVSIFPTRHNPAFHLFLMATAEPYHLNWPAGENKMLLVSVGTGLGANARSKPSPHELHLLYNASSIPAALMFAALNEQDFLCRVFGKCIIGGWLDREVKDMIGKQGPAVPKLFTYLRYNADLTADDLKALSLPHIIPKHVQKMDSVKYIADLREVGQAVAQKVTITDLDGFLS